MPHPLDYHKPTTKADPFRFNVLCAIGCAFGVIVAVIVVLDRAFDLGLIKMAYLISG